MTATVITKGNMTAAQYRALHQWVSRELGIPSKCENCNITTATRFEWANISGEYLRELSDWARLCKRCHSLIDNQGQHFRNRFEKSDVCKNGHPRTAENLYINPLYGFKSCNVCRAQNVIKHRKRNICARCGLTIRTDHKPHLNCENKLSI